MSSLNYRFRSSSAQNAAGINVPSISPEKQLRRLVMACMLWEKQFYVDGDTSVDTIKSLVPKVDADTVASLAIEARTSFKLRHVPLLLCRELARIGKLKAETLTAVIQRADEMSEFLAMYWSEKRSPLSNQVKKGLSNAFLGFNEYALAKWDKNSAVVSLRDVMFLTHPKPTSPEQEALFKRVATKELATPDTWETELSAGKDKLQTWNRLLSEKKLGALAFLRNLRNMSSAGVSVDNIIEYSKTVNVDRVLPFRYVAAVMIVPQFKGMLENMMFRSLAKADKLDGKTILMVDVSLSMFNTKVSEKSDLDRFDAAAALAMLCREICSDVAIYTFSDRLVQVPNDRGFNLHRTLKGSQPISGTNLATALNHIHLKEYERLIVITDEASTESGVPNAKIKKSYMLNVGSYQNGVNLSSWTTITGFSESVINYIQAVEQE